MDQNFDPQLFLQTSALGFDKNGEIIGSPIMTWSELELFPYIMADNGLIAEEANIDG